MPDPFPEISPLDCLSALADSNAPVMLDIRLPEDVNEAPASLPTARAIAYDDLDAQLAMCRAGAQVRGAIVICHKGLKLSAGATARLLAHGIAAQRLQGGHMAWQEAGLPVQPLDAPRPDRLAVPLDATPEEVLNIWAALRFAAPWADLLEVPRDDLTGVCDRFAASAPADLILPPLPGVDTLRQMALAPASFLAALLAGAARPSQAFASLDLAYRGTVRSMPISEGLNP